MNCRKVSPNGGVSRELSALWTAFFKAHDLAHAVNIELRLLFRKWVVMHGGASPSIFLA